MRNDHTFGCMKPPLRVIGEVRTADSGKLLFQLADNGGEAVIMLKLRGIETVYCLPINTLSTFFNKLM